MKVKELMLGDLALYEYNGEKIHARVVEIYRSSALVESVSKEYEPIEIAEDKLFPIAITPEILEKNGFSRNGLDIALFDRRGGDDFVGASNLQCVHELQHSLRDCGIEKEITI